MKIILASGSPRRKELLVLAGYEFAVEVSEVDEQVSNEDPANMVEELSFRKASAVAVTHGEEEDCIILGADTIVVHDGIILGKPQDEKEARRMLEALSGSTHQVYTGVTLVHTGSDNTTHFESFHEKTDVTMRNLTTEEISAYINTGEPMDKAGAYAIQGKAAVFISKINGDYYNVVGLPLCKTARHINKMLTQSASQCRNLSL